MAISLMIVFIFSAFNETGRGSDYLPVSAELGQEHTQPELVIDDKYKWPNLDVKLLTINPYSRSGKKLEQVNNIVIHYVGNPNTSAIANRNYFESLSDGQGSKASSHFVVGLEKEIVQCVPLAEIAYASNKRNKDTISIEVCHPDETGKFSDSTYAKVVELSAWLCLRYRLSADDLIRHYDVTGKICPKYYVENEDAWNKMKQDVKEKMKDYPVKED